MSLRLRQSFFLSLLLFLLERYGSLTGQVFLPFALKLSIVLFLEMIMARKVYVWVLITEIEQLLGVLLMPLKVQARVEGLRKVFSVQLGPAARRLLLHQDEVILTDCLILITALLLTDLAPERQVEHILDLGANAEAKHCHSHLSFLYVYLYLCMVGATRGVESMSQLNFKMDSLQVLSPVNCRLDHIISVELLSSTVESLQLRVVDFLAVTVCLKHLLGILARHFFQVCLHSVDRQPNYVQVVGTCKHLHAARFIDKTDQSC